MERNTKGINSAITDLLNFRIDEGKKLEEDIKFRIDNLDVTKQNYLFQKQELKK